jgi:hypothetical protein
MTETPRHILVVAHTGRQDSLEAAATVCEQLIAAGAVPVLAADERADLLASCPQLNGSTAILGETVSATDLELVIVLGGDGTILRAAEIVRGCSAPLLGINLGHVGFLAESERDDLGEAVRRALLRDYLVEERMTLSVRVKVDHEVVYETWALNEATVEKGSRQRMIEVIIVHPHRLHRLLVLRRRPDRVAEPGRPAAGAAERPRPLRPAPRGGPGLLPGRGGARPHREPRGALRRRSPRVRPATGRPRDRASFCGAGAPGPAAQRSVHRPAGEQVQPAHHGLARPGRPGMRL